MVSILSCGEWHLRICGGRETDQNLRVFCILIYTAYCFSGKQSIYIHVLSKNISLYFSKSMTRSRCSVFQNINHVEFFREDGAKCFEKRRICSHIYTCLNPQKPLRLITVTGLSKFQLYPEVHEISFLRTTFR